MDAAHRNRYPIGMFFRQKPIQIESLVVELNREKIRRKITTSARESSVFLSFFSAGNVDVVVISSKLPFFSARIIPDIESTK